MDLFENICVILAVLSLVAFSVPVIRKRHSAPTVISLLLAAIIVSSIFMFLPYYRDESRDLEMGGLRAAVFSLFYGLKAMAGGQEIKLVENFKLTSPLLDGIYRVMNYIYFIAAPLLTSSLVLSLIGDRWDRLRFRLSLKKHYHIFSVLNGNSLDIAGQISKKYPKDRIVFCQTKDCGKELLAGSRALGALDLYLPCQGLKLPFRRKRISFYLICGDEDVNLRTAEQLILAHREKTAGKIVINALAESGTGIEMVESMEKGRIAVRFINGTALLCSKLLLQHPLYDLPEGRDTVSVMIVGCHRTGMQMLKTVAWCGQMEGFKLKLRVYDKNAKTIEQRLLAQCPELPLSCDIRFFQVDADSENFRRCVLDPLQGSPDATYIITAMGDDERNITVAEELFRLFRAHNRFGYTPQILARVRSGAKSSVYVCSDNAYLQTRRIRLFGSMEELFSANVLFHSYPERLALAVDLCYNDLLPEKDACQMTEEELRDYLASPPVEAARNRFLDSEYNRRSSLAAALHIPVKLYSCGLLSSESSVPSDKVALDFRQMLAADPGLTERLARDEHRRWNSFMRSEGYRRATAEDLRCFYPTLRKPGNQDPLSKRHLCIVDWEELDEAYRVYMALKPPYKKNFKDSDRDIVRKIPQIILLANRLEQTELDLDLPRRKK